MEAMARPSRRRKTSRGAFERARASGKPSIIEIKLDPEAITPMKTLTQIRDKT